MKNIFRYFITAIFTAAVFGGIGAVETDAQTIRELLDRMDKHYKALSSLQANISRKQANPQVGTSEDSSGKVVMVPGKGRAVSLRLDWLKPREETLSVANGKYQLYVPSISRAYRGSTSSQKVNESGGGVLSLMSMSETELKTKFSSRYIGKETLGGEDVWHIELTPRGRENFKMADLWIDSDGMPIQAKMTAHNNETDTLQFSAVKRNETINAAVFKVKVAKDTEVVTQ